MLHAQSADHRDVRVAKDGPVDVLAADVSAMHYSVGLIFFWKGPTKIIGAVVVLRAVIVGDLMSLSHAAR